MTPRILACRGSGRARRGRRLARRSQSQAATPPQDPAPVFRAGADVVTVEASVRRDRRAVVGLTAADFELLDNGVAQEISDVTYEKLPIDVTVLLDVSSSVTGPVLDELRRSLQQLRTDLGSRDRLRIVTFDMRIRRIIDFADPSSATDSALASVVASGSSAVFDSLAVALTAPVPAGRRQLIMLFSDGQDSSSISDAETLLDVARRSAPTVAVVLASTSTKRPASLQRNATKLGTATIAGLADQIANDTGGYVVAINPRRQPDVDVPAGPRAVSHHLRALLHAERRRPSGVPHPRGAREARESRRPRPPRLRLAIADRRRPAFAGR